MKNELLQTIEGLMNEVIYSAKNTQEVLTQHFNIEYPCVVWKWNNGFIEVTDFIQKEL